MEKDYQKYFLAANSCEGFVSQFSNCYDPKDGWKAYIIKGGPGTGKSTFMKYMLKKGTDKGLKAELFPCSSDPDSLDAVSFPEIKTVIMDGTSPHTVDPIYPAAVDTILNFSQFWNEEKITSDTEEIIKLTDKNKALHKTASLYLQAAGKLICDNIKIASANTYKNRVNKYAEKLCKKYLRDKETTGKESIRYLSGVTPKGIVSFGDSVITTCEELVIIEDQFGFVTNILMKKIREYSLEKGYEIITLNNALIPTLTDHIIIPELSLAVVRESEYQHFKKDIRRIHARRFMDLKELNKSREKIKFNKKVTKELLLSAIETLKKAKDVHDQLESFYIKAMDFEALTQFAKKYEKEIFR